MDHGTLENKQFPALEPILSAVASDHRRAVLRSLSHTDEEGLTVHTLVDRVTEDVRNGDLPDDDHRRRVHTALHHVHLPKLEACGMIVHDPETDRVRDVTGELGQELLALTAPYEAPG